MGNKYEVSQNDLILELDYFLSKAMVFRFEVIYIDFDKISFFSVLWLYWKHLIFEDRIGSLVVQPFASRKEIPSNSRNRTGRGAELESDDGINLGT